MQKPESAATLPSPSVGELNVPHPARDRGSVDPGPALRRLRYHLDLLEAGYRQALHPDLQAPSQRAERMALGIDRPELDTIPFWSVRRPDGAVAIPFIEFVLGEIHRGLETVARAASLADPRSGVRIREGRRLVARILEAIDAGRWHRTVPRLGDLYLPGDLVARICGPNGLLRRLRRDCDAGFGDGDAERHH